MENNYQVVKEVISGVYMAVDKPKEYENVKIPIYKTKKDEVCYSLHQMKTITYDKEKKNYIITFNDLNFVPLSESIFNAKIKPYLNIVNE